MAVAVTRDLTVQVSEDVNTVKLTDTQQALRTAVQRGEPKSLGVSQVMLGLMVMSYSIPLHFTQSTEVVILGVPWWSGLMFIIAGVVAIVLDKHCSFRNLQVCLLVTVVSLVLSVVAIIIYSVDIERNPEVDCSMDLHSCNEKYYAVKMSRGLKSSLLLFTVAQTVISGLLGFLLLRQRRNFGQYSSLDQAAAVTSSMLLSPEHN
ncbi:transmembrane protein 176 [Betta splendens]|uniref:Transmembrane protein 176 n=1 Tax=Betta splendens TaxID=158456 RepID=A0A6P7M1L2_BETSP|nr:transmembrane protein 176 [Betta splendens]XP_029000085.1 transmembrane protein 176 [Betta splendens]XP_029000094.1 transmembrane protein 176 [Betta splendens]